MERCLRGSDDGHGNGKEELETSPGLPDRQTALTSGGGAGGQHGETHGISHSLALGTSAFFFNLYKQKVFLQWPKHTQFRGNYNKAWHQQDKEAKERKRAKPSRGRFRERRVIGMFWEGRGMKVGSRSAERMDLKSLRDQMGPRVSPFHLSLLLFLCLVSSEDNF